MKRLILFSMASAFLALTSCTHLQTVSLTSIPPKRDHPIKAETSKFIFLGLNFDNDYVDQMTTQLKNQCPDGIISGVLTKDEVVDYFLFIFMSHKVSATAYCSKAGSRVGQQAGKPRRPSSDGDTPAEQALPVEPGYIE